MSLVLDGSGIISGLAAGGLPSGSVIPASTQSGALPLMIRLNNANAYGSTNTKIRRFANVTFSQGTDVTYADSATLGASFTINVPGVYALSYSDQFASTASMGISLNTTAPATAIYSIPVAEILVSAQGNGNNSGCASGTFFLSAGSVVRPHTDAIASGGNPNLSQFTITRVA